MKKLQFKKLDYIMVMVENMNRSIEFYRDTLGIPLRFSSESWTEFDTGSTTFALHGGAKPRTSETSDLPHRDLSGTCSIGFNVEDLQGTYEHLKSQGVNFTLPPTARQNEGIMLAIATDPDGTEISFAQAIKQ